MAATPRTPAGPRSAAPARPHPSFSDALRALPDDALVALLRERPDLASPSPSTLRSLAARASSRTSLERVLARQDALVLAVLEAVLVLGPPAQRGDDAPAPDDGPRTPDVVAALGTAADGAAAVRAAIDGALVRGLLWDAGDDPRDPVLRACPGLDEVLGPYPAGLGPARPAGVPEPAADALDDLPPGAREVLDALAWGPPVGVAPPRTPGRPATAARAAVDALLARHLLLASDDRHVVLPRDVGLRLRGGRTHRDLAATAPRPAGRDVPRATVDAEAASAALEVVRQVGVLVTAWEASPPPLLRAGGLGVRDLRRAAQALETDEPTAAVVVELAAAAGLVADDGDAPASYVPTDRALDWEDLDDASRWALLAGAWATARRTPWLVGSRDEKGTLRAPLSPDLHRPWVPRLRASVLDVLAAGRTDDGATAPGPDAVGDVLRWRTPRAVPPAQAVAGLLREAAVLGVTGAGALSGPGEALHATLAAGPTDPDALATVLADALAVVLPAEVDEVLLQGDLTGIVPGRPSRDLSALLGRSADVESRGAATTVRFSPASVTRALDHGLAADDLLAALGARSPVPVPQPLAYLVHDVARRHEALRVGSAGSYVRAADAAALAGLAEDPALAGLGLVRLAPTVLAAAVPAAELQEALRGRGLLPALEGPDGRVLQLERRRPRAVARPAGVRRLGGARPADDAAPARVPVARLAELVARLRTADAAPGSGVGRPEGWGTPGTGGTPGTAETTDSAPAPAQGRATGPTSSSSPAGAHGHRPADAPGVPDSLALLREAIRDGERVWVEVVGPTGSPTRRLLRPLRLDAGRLRALDTDREAELTVAVHRIAAVEPADA